jgi:hypothetical protein
MSESKKQLALFNVVDKIEKSTSTVAELRVPIFAPVQKLSGNSVTAREFKKNGGIRTIRTSWGKVEIRGRKLLTQVHRDLLDCIYTHAKDVKRLENGNVAIIFSQTKVLKEYSSEERSSSWENQTKWLKDKIKEIRDITVNYENTKGDHSDFNIISNLDYSEDYKLYSITLDERYLRFYEKELSISYKKELPKLLRVNSALVKAIIRWLFTHKDDSKFKLMTILVALGFPVDSPKTLQVAKRELKDRVAEFRTFAIEYDPEEEIFSYRGNPNVGFIPSLFNSRKALDRNSSERIPEISRLKGEKIYISEKNSTFHIHNFDFEIENGKTVYVVVTTVEGFEFKINNKRNLSKKDFQNELYELLSTLLVKK